MTFAPGRDGTEASAVLTKAVIRASALLGLTDAGLGRALGVTVARVSAMTAGRARLQIESKPAELAALLVRVYQSLDLLVGFDADARALWMRSENRAFNAAPKDAVLTAEGLVRVVTYLEAVASAG